MPMHPSPIAAVLIHVPKSDWRAALAWYQSAFPRAKRVRIESHDFECLELDGVRLELVCADEKVASGAAGSVVYWRVADLDATLNHFKGLGVALYRGPLKIEDELWMCQVRDRWGNCIGLRGPRGTEEV